MQPHYLPSSLTLVTHPHSSLTLVPHTRHSTLVTLPYLPPSSIHRICARCPHLNRVCSGEVLSAHIHSPHHITPPIGSAPRCPHPQPPPDLRRDFSYLTPHRICADVPAPPTGSATNCPHPPPDMRRGAHATLTLATQPCHSPSPLSLIIFSVQSPSSPSLATRFR